MRKNIDAEPRFASERIGGVTGARPQQVLCEPTVSKDQIEREHLRLKGGKLLDGRVHWHRQELARRFHLQWFIHRDVQVGDILIGVEHLLQDVIEFVTAHNRVLSIK